VCAARKPAVPKTSGRGKDGGSTTTASRASHASSRSPDGRSTARTDRSNGALAVSLDGVGGVGMVLVANDRWALPLWGHFEPRACASRETASPKTCWGHTLGPERARVQPAVVMQMPCVSACCDAGQEAVRADGSGMIVQQRPGSTATNKRWPSHAEWHGQSRRHPHERWRSVSITHVGQIEYSVCLRCAARVRALHTCSADARMAGVFAAPRID
jgi:hypothetical protein